MEITANGDHALNISAAATAIVLVSGVSGGATMTLTYKNYGTNTGYMPLSSGVLAIGEQYVVHKGEGIELYCTVTGATGTTVIDIDVGAG